jgi:hypothetical protein
MMKTILLQMVKTSRARINVRIESFNCSSWFIAQLPAMACEHLYGIEERLQDMSRLSNMKRQWSFSNKCSNKGTVPINFCSGAQFVCKFKDGGCIHEQIIACGCEADVLVGRSSLVDMYAKCGSSEDA